MIIWDWLGYFWHGILQIIGLIVPILQPATEPVVPYVFFEDCEEFYTQWGSLLDENQRPTDTWMRFYWNCLWSILTFRIEDRIWVIADAAYGWVHVILGYVPAPFNTVPEWLLAIRGWIGEILPDWATDIADGLWRLWNLLPEPIRDGLLTWAEFMAGAPEAILAWIQEAIGDFLAMLAEVWDWYVDLGQALTTWWQSAQVQLSEIVNDAYGWIVTALGAAWSFLVWFWGNPTGAIASWLSPWWSQLTTFATDCLDFWYNLWGSYAEDLAELLADPLDFLWDRGEAWLNRKLEQP